MPRLSSGSPLQLGATVDPTGTNFALISHHAERVELCLFDASGDVETARIALPEKTAGIWHGHIEGIGTGQRYGYRVHGPFDPGNGQRFNRNKLLIDPYARAIDRPFKPAPSMLGYLPDHPDQDLSFNPADSARDMPKAIVVAAAAARDTRPRIPWQDTVIYEMHVKGFTKQLEPVPPPLRGTFSALGEPAALEHLVKLGVTTLELMPIAALLDERHLPPLGLHNYWGYNPITFLAPDPRLAGGDGLEAIRKTVERVHAAGLEIVLDVVFNHTGESDELGATVCYRGIDNALYYRLKPREPRFYDNVTGCGNSLAVDRPPVLRLVMDAMRHWVTEIGIDGFRFDLAATLARDENGFQAEGVFLAALQQDPVLNKVKLIAEPWDLGPGGYRGGGFPPGMAEWNDKFRDDMRRFWQGSAEGVGALASRLTGSSDRFDPRRRRPSESVNYITAHDGFSLLDLVSYAVKHNAANGEHNADGSNANISWNHGTEGPSPDLTIEAARRADVKALIASLLVSRGTPMLRSGDELGQTQGGNNNAYAQDNATTWIDWTRAAQFADLTAFTRRAIAVRKAHPALHRDRFLTGRPTEGAAEPDAVWRRADGAVMTDADWRDGARKFLGLELNEPSDEGETDHVYLLINGGDSRTVTLPPAERGWQVLLDSAVDNATPFATGATLSIAARAVVVLGDLGGAVAQDHPELLDRLAVLAGIEPQHRDATGHEHIVGAQTKRALLGAMRIPAANAAQIRESLAALTEEPWRATLPPVIRARAGEPLAVDVIVAQAAAGDRLEAVLGCEDGERRVVQFRPSDGTPQEARRVDGARREKWRIALPGDVPSGVHRLRIGDAEATILAAPDRIWQPPVLAQGKCWGVAVNLYAARSARDWGIGDFSTLGEIVARTAQHGGALVGINPVHALFPDRPDHVSPYYPSDRRFLEPAYIDVATMPDYRELAAGDPWFAEAERDAAILRAAPLVDYGAVFALKQQAFRKIWTRFRARRDRAGDPLGDAFRTFIHEGGDALQRFAAWPEADADEVRYRMFLQWWADRSLAEASGGLSIGLYRDLAVGPAPYGAEAELCKSAFAAGVAVGSPPDPYSATGQVWRVSPFDPRALRQLRFAPWRDLVRANMRHAGALRLDHVMGLERLLWIPEGATALQGAYVRNDSSSLLAILAIESHRRQCLVVGEDLGTVPSGFRERMAAAGLYAMCVILFERDDAGFAPGSRYARQSVAMFGTHDLPPFAGWWKAHARDPEGEAMAAALKLDAARANDPAERSAAVHAFLGQSGSAIALAQYDDLAGEVTPVNVPGTVAEHPNWRRRTARSVAAVFEAPEGARGIEAVASGRGPHGN